jgi:hypothetical protein
MITLRSYVIAFLLQYSFAAQPRVAVTDTAIEMSDYRIGSSTGNQEREAAYNTYGPYTFEHSQSQMETRSPAEENELARVAATTFNQNQQVDRQPRHNSRAIRALKDERANFFLFLTLSISSVVVAFTQIGLLQKLLVASPLSAQTGIIQFIMACAAVPVIPYTFALYKQKLTFLTAGTICSVHSDKN